MDDTKRDVSIDKGGASLGRRDVMKLGVGAGVAMAIPASAAAVAAEPAPVPMPEPQAAAAMSDAPTGGLQRGQFVSQFPNIAESKQVLSSTSAGYTVHTGPGWVNNANRAYGNGPMDVVTTRLVKYVSEFSPEKMTPSTILAASDVMIDGLACMFSGFESDPARINARVCQKYPMSGTGEGVLKSTMLGYGLVTTPETAAFGNGAMIRHSDYNDHKTETLGGILAIAEAVHATGLQTLGAVTIAYELIQGMSLGAVVDQAHVQFDDWARSPITALACGKLMGLNEDQLGNAVSLALMAHIPLYARAGVQTMWKGSHSSRAIACGVWAAVIASEGFTGPCEPFEGRDGLLTHIGPPTRDLKLPVYPNGTVIELTNGKGGGGYKRYPCEGTTTDLHNNVIPDLRAWTKPEEIASIEIQVADYTWLETNDPTKWDPRCRESADHSMPYELARGILGGSKFNNGYIFMDNFSKEQYMDPKARDLMSKMITRPNLDPSFGASTVVLTIRKTSGEDRVFKTKPTPPFLHDDIVEKFHKTSSFRKVDKAQADKILQQWSNLKDEKDICNAIATVAKFGQPKPLSDKSPSDIS